MNHLPEKQKEGEKKNTFEDLLLDNRYQIALLLVGVVLIAFGALIYKKQGSTNSNKIEVLENASEDEGGENKVVVEIGGAVEKPGIYSFDKNSRVEDLMIASGGLSDDADRIWVEKIINRAAKLVDGQKYYIPTLDEQSNVLSANKSGGNQSGSDNFSSAEEGLININDASQKELESIKGIGPGYGSNIIEHRPYSTLEELVSKGAIGQKLFEKIKDKISVY